jgi:hypothetical protein
MDHRPDHSLDRRVLSEEMSMLTQQLKESFLCNRESKSRMKIFGTG